MKIDRGTFDITKLTSRDIQNASYQHWLEDGHRNNEILYVWDFTLPFDGATVIDLGGYEGNWSARMLEKYPTIIKELLIYEPVPQYYEKIKERFKDDFRVTVYPFAASNYDGTQTINIQGAGSSANIVKEAGGESIDIGTVDIGVHIKKHFKLWDIIPEPKIHLIKMNIEGDEYRAIESLRRNGILPCTKSLCIQCHPFGKDPIADYELLFKTLDETHERQWNYPFIWEYWKLK